MKIAESLSATVALIGACVGGYIYIDDRYALAEEHEEMVRRLDKTEIRMAIQQAMQHYYFLKSQLNKYPDDRELKEEVIEAKKDIDLLKKQLSEKELQDGKKS